MCNGCDCEDEEEPNLFKALKEEAHRNKKIEKHKNREDKKKMQEEIEAYNDGAANILTTEQTQ